MLGFVHVAYDDLGALERHAIRRRRGGDPRIDPRRGRGDRTRPPGYLTGGSRLCDEQGDPLDRRRGADRARPDRADGSASTRAGSSLTSSPCAKALGNGMPIGACWARSEVAAAFGPGDHGTTFGGQPLAAAAAAATLAGRCRGSTPPSLAAKAGARLRAGLEVLGGVESVRGQGLLIGVQLTSTSATEVAAECCSKDSS